MTETHYFDGVKGKTSFSRQELLQSFRNGGFGLSDASFCKKLESMVKDEEIIRAGRNIYCFPKGNKAVYRHEYSALANAVAAFIKGQYPLLAFSILDLIQLNDFVNHQIAHNILLLSVETDIMEFIFDALKEQYPGKVFIEPTPEIYHQYWCDDMIIIVKLTTEAPKGRTESWHTRLEKLLVDIMSEPLIPESISESEFPNIYEGAFARYVIDEGCLFRYAKRRKAEQKIRKLITEQTNITLRQNR